MFRRRHFGEEVFSLRDRSAIRAFSDPRVLMRAPMVGHRPSTLQAFATFSGTTRDTEPRAYAPRQVDQEARYRLSNQTAPGMSARITRARR